MENNQKREKFSSGIAVFFATLGSAIGLGNIWKFPYVVGKNGGGAFLIIYLLCVAFAGIPVMVSEFYIGRKTRKNVMGAIESIKPKSIFKSIGIFGVLAAYLIMFFYSDVAGWVYFYVFKVIKGDFIGLTGDQIGAEFGKTIVGPVSPIIWQFIVFIVVASILFMGVQKGIEKVTKTLLPVLLILVLVCSVRALTLPGAGEGLSFLFKPDFSKITTTAIITALGLAFFKLSLGMGCMVTYGSYFTDDNNMIHTAGKVALADIGVSLLAGIAIFPTLFTYNMKPDSGPGLLFIAIPLVFSKMPFGTVLLGAFFTIAAIAATTAMLSLVQVPIAFFSEELNMKRGKAVIINVSIMFIIGILATLSADKGSLLWGVKILGYSFFDLFDKISSNILLPLGGLLISILVGYFVDKKDLFRELSNNKTLKNEKLLNLYYFLLRYITPILVLVVFLVSINIIKF